jgi:hypothetical protein
MSHVKTARKMQAETIISALEKRNMTAFYCEDTEACRQKVLELVPAESVISWGGSMSIHECGIPQALKDRGDCEVLDRSTYVTPEQQKEFAVKTFQCNYYLMSSNAITLDGELVNIDGAGNRVSSLIFGPDHVIVVAGMNKVEDDLDAAVNRARTVAAPMNQQRFQLPNPCTGTGTCADCKSQTCICNHIVITRHCRPVGRIKFILVGEDLGM